MLHSHLMHEKEKEIKQEERKETQKTSISQKTGRQQTNKHVTTEGEKGKALIIGQHEEYHSISTHLIPHMENIGMGSGAEEKDIYPIRDILGHIFILSFPCFFLFLFPWPHLPFPGFFQTFSPQFWDRIFGLWLWRPGDLHSPLSYVGRAASSFLLPCIFLFLVHALHACLEHQTMPIFFCLPNNLKPLSYNSNENIFTYLNK